MSHDYSSLTTGSAEQRLSGSHLHKMTSLCHFSPLLGCFLYTHFSDCHFVCLLCCRTVSLLVFAFAHTLVYETTVILPWQKLKLWVAPCIFLSIFQKCSWWLIALIYCHLCMIKNNNKQNSEINHKTQFIFFHYSLQNSPRCCLWDFGRS